MIVLQYVFAPYSEVGVLFQTFKKLKMWETFISR
jgi:hypothetical protein